MTKKVIVLAIVAILLPMAAMNAISNSPPEKPTITGPTSGEAGKTYTYTIVTTDPDGDKVKYCINWGDGNEFCTDYVKSGQEVQVQHSWQDKGSYTITVTATDEHGAESQPATLKVSMPLPSTQGYHGYLRIYVVEPISRWKDHDGDNYKFGFLDFAYDDVVYADYGKVVNINAVWDSSKFPNVNENNIMAIAVLFNPTPHSGNANPPFGNPFDAYYVDACAAAMPGETGVNERNNETTHTVFVEMGTATYCPYCPSMLSALYSIYQKGELPFYFVSLVGDKNQVAYDYLHNHYNLYGYPTAFFDGGRYVMVGGGAPESTYERYIQKCMEKDVHDFNMSVHCEWKNGKLYVNVTLLNLESGDDVPPVMDVEVPKAGHIYILNRDVAQLPLSYAISIGKITMKVKAQDESGVEKVMFKVVHKETYNDTEAPYEFTFKGFGKYTVEIYAYDVFGNYAKYEVEMIIV